MLENFCYLENITSKNRVRFKYTLIQLTLGYLLGNAIDRTIVAQKSYSKVRPFKIAF